MKFRAVAVAALIFVSASIQAGILARFHMNADLGTIDVELFDKERPITVSNFVAYVKAGKWHDTQIQRWDDNFVIQGGQYVLPHHPQLMTPFTGGGDRSRIVPFPSIPFEGHLGTWINNSFGTIAMARTADTNSATADWFFNLANNTFLDTPPGYTVFGRTVRGTNTLNKFNAPAPSAKLYTVTDPSLPAGSFVPIYSLDGTNGFWVNVDITLLTAQIRQAGALNEISWNSVEGVQNVVEFTNVLPPVWQTVQSVAGTGAQMTISDNPGADKFRHYRVRVVYP